MSPERIREALKRQPFEPFDVRLADGRRFTIPHPDYITMPPGGRISHVVIYTTGEDVAEGNYRSHWIEPNLIAELTIPSDAPTATRPTNGA